jgi:hypothetical protein
LRPGGSEEPRERLRKGNIAQAFFQKVLKQARERSLLSWDMN